MMKFNQSGFSLIESMVVVSILGVLVMLAVPDILVWSANQRLRSDVSDLQRNLQVARNTAINRNAPITLRLNAPAANQYIIFVDDGQGGGTARDLIKNGGEIELLQGTLDTDVTIKTINVAGGAFLFNGRGLRARPIVDPANVIVQNNKGREYQIFVTMTGDINGNYL